MQKHELDALSLTCGLVLLTIGLVFLTGSVDPYGFLSVWGLPLGLVTVGLVLGATAFTRIRSSRKP